MLHLPQNPIYSTVEFAIFWDGNMQFTFLVQHDCQKCLQPPLKTSVSQALDKVKTVAMTTPLELEKNPLTEKCCHLPIHKHVQNIARFWRRAKALLVPWASC